MLYSQIASVDQLSMPSKLRNLVQAQRPEIRIILHSKKKAYTTMDRIEGVISVTAPTDTSFDTIDIEFVGTSRTYVERLTTATAASGRSEAFHQFLKLSQPGVAQNYPEDNILRAGQTYKFPFVFAVPQQLLPRICQHSVRSDAVRDAHYRLPPTFGDKNIGSRSEAADDMAPDMASVRYGVFAKITKLKNQGEDCWRTTVASRARRIRVVPAADEQPPLDVHAEDGEYIMRREKKIKKNMFKGRLGSLVMEAQQPQSLRLRSSSNPEARTSTVATVMLRFDPTDDKSQPPRLGSLSSKLKVATYFASTARHSFPSKNSSLLDLTQGLHTEQLNLSSRCMANVEWTKHDPSKPFTPERRDSANSISSITAGTTPSPSSTYKDKAYYTACLLVPITLPTNKAFVPTFHSCLISRVYAIKLDLGIQSAGLGPSMELKVPVQISADGPSEDELLTRRDSIDSQNEAEADVEDISSFFEARTTRAPSEGFVAPRGRVGSLAPVDDAPPGYSPFVPNSAARMNANRRMSVPVY